MKPPTTITLERTDRVKRHAARGCGRRNVRHQAGRCADGDVKVARHRFRHAHTGRHRDQRRVGLGRVEPQVGKRGRPRVQAQRANVAVQRTDPGVECHRDRRPRPGHQVTNLILKSNDGLLRPDAGRRASAGLCGKHDRRRRTSRDFKRGRRNRVCRARVRGGRQHVVLPTIRCRHVKGDRVKGCGSARDRDRAGADQAPAKRTAGHRHRHRPVRVGGRVAKGVVERHHRRRAEIHQRSPVVRLGLKGQQCCRPRRDGHRRRRHHQALQFGHHRH